MRLSWPDIELALLLWGGVAAWLLWHRRPLRSRIAERLQTVVHQQSALEQAIEARDAERRPRWVGLLVQLGNGVTFFTPAQRGALAAQLVHAGWRSPTAVSALIAIKLLCGALALFLALWPPLPPAFNTLFMHSLFCLGACVVGMILPEYLLRAQIGRRQRQIAHALPDALDLMVICTHAGFSLAVSLQRTAEEMRRIVPALGDELEVTFGELQLSGDTSTALRNMADRIGTQSVRSLVVTLLQSQQYGTPITQALRQLARTERARRMLRLEERAAKLSTRITLPMMLFILPAVVMIAAGPALMSLLKMMEHSQ